MIYRQRNLGARIEFWCGDSTWSESIEARGHGGNNFRNNCLTPISEAEARQATGEIGIPLPAGPRYFQLVAAAVSDGEPIQNTLKRINAGGTVSFADYSDSTDHKWSKSVYTKEELLDKNIAVELTEEQARMMYPNLFPEPADLNQVRYFQTKGSMHIKRTVPGQPEKLQIWGKCSTEWIESAFTLSEFLAPDREFVTVELTEAEAKAKFPRAFASPPLPFGIGQQLTNIKFGPATCIAVTESEHGKTYTLQTSDGGASVTINEKWLKWILPAS
jgi:hypothetical protein